MLTKNEFIKKLKEARASQLLSEQRLTEIFQDYNLEVVHFRSTNSNNLGEAIQCYILYGELPLSGNIDDFLEKLQEICTKGERTK